MENWKITLENEILVLENLNTAKSYEFTMLDSFKAWFLGESTQDGWDSTLDRCDDKYYAQYIEKSVIYDVEQIPDSVIQALKSKMEEIPSILTADIFDMKAEFKFYRVKRDLEDFLDAGDELYTTNISNWNKLHFPAVRAKYLHFPVLVNELKDRDLFDKYFEAIEYNPGNPLLKINMDSLLVRTNEQICAHRDTVVRAEKELAEFRASLVAKFKFAKMQL